MAAKKNSVLSLVVASMSFCGCLLAQQPASEERTVFDESIAPVHVEELPYPPLARMARIQGVVVIRAKLDSQGRVASSVALSGRKILINDCLENSKKWRFQPTPENVAVIVYDFRLEGSCYFDLPCLSQFTFRPPNLATIKKGFPVVDTSSGGGR